MRLSAAVTAVVRTLRSPADLLPFYLLGAAIPAVVRTAPFLAIAVAWLYLERAGRIDRFGEELAAIDARAPDPEADPEAFGDWLDEITSAVDVLLPPTVLVLLVVSVLVAGVAWVFLQAVISAGQIATCFARLRSERGLVAGVAGARRYWLAFLGLFVLEFVLWIATTVVLAIVLALAVAMTLVAPLAVVLAVPLALIAILGWFVGLVAIRALFAFAPVAVVVDDRDALGSVSSSYGFLRARPVEAVFYFVVTLIATIGVTGLLSSLATLGTGSLVSIVLFALVFPTLDLLKTVLYGEYRDSVSPPPAFDRSLRRQLGDGIRHGLAEMAAFVRSTPGIHAFVVAVGVVSFWLGWIAAGPFVDVFPASIETRIEGIVPPVAALEFFGNNWSVALLTAFSGVALAIPALASIAFNGVFLGGIARLEVAPLELLAFVAPHGLFEIPAILVSGSVGVYLGIVYWRVVRGRAGRASLADALERSFWVLVGVGVLLAIAAILEGFVSPFYFGPFL